MSFTNDSLRFRNRFGSNVEINDFPYNDLGVLAMKKGFMGEIRAVYGLKPTQIDWENKKGSNSCSVYLKPKREYFITCGYSVRSSPHEVQALQRIYVKINIENGTSSTRNMFFPIMCYVDGALKTNRFISFSSGGVGMGSVVLKGDNSSPDPAVWIYKIEIVEQIEVTEYE